MKQKRNILQMVFKSMLLFAVVWEIGTLPVSAIETTDAGRDFQDRLLFLGESTTAHLRSRGVLSGGRETTQVLVTESGTLLLDGRILSAKVWEPVCGRYLTIPEAIRARQPEYLVLSFGLNGIGGFLRDPDRYGRHYHTLIAAVHEASPQTVVLLQTVYPVAKEQSDWHFEESPAKINEGIRQLNAWLPEIAARESAVLIDTASVLTDADGFLRADFSADGIHLSRSGYEAVLGCLRAHAKEVTGG